MDEDGGYHPQFLKWIFLKVCSFTEKKYTKMFNLINHYILKFQ